jgi:hypothetical protein
MNTKALLTATIIGLVLQLIMVGGGHFAPKATQAWLFPVGGMGFSLIAGLVFAYLAAAAWGASLLGGAVAGGVCALLGIAVSVLLKDVPPSLLLLGTVSSVVTGAIGAAIGKLLPHGG